MDKQVFAEQMGNLGVVFDREVSKQVLDLYYEDLKSLTNAQMIDAVTKWRKAGRFFPRPSELLDMLKTSKSSAGEAWAHVLKQLRDSQNADLTPAELNTVNEIGGIDALAHMTYSQLEFKSKDFKAAYTPDRLGDLKERLDHDPQFKALGKLIGSPE